MAKKSKKQSNKFIKWISIKNNQVAFVFALPIIGWLIGCVINPSGWASNLGGLMSLMFGIPIVYFVISLPLIAYLLYLIKQNKKQLFAGVLFVASLLFAIVIAIITATADEDEFNG